MTRLLQKWICNNSQVNSSSFESQRECEYNTSFTSCQSNFKCLHCLHKLTELLFWLLCMCFPIFTSFIIYFMAKVIYVFSGKKQIREDNLFHCHYTEKATISLLIYSVSLLMDVLCNYFFFKNGLMLYMRFWKLFFYYYFTMYHEHIFHAHGWKFPT